MVAKTLLVLPSIGSGRKAHFPVRHRFFDPGVCSRSGWTVSSRDVELVVQFEQRLNFFERLVGRVGFECKSITSRMFGVCVLHVRVGTILPSGPLSAIASFGSSEGHSLSVGPSGRVSLARKNMDAHLRDHARRGLRTLFADAVSSDCLLINSPVVCKKSAELERMQLPVLRRIPKFRFQTNSSKFDGLKLGK